MQVLLHADDEFSSMSPTPPGTSLLQIDTVLAASAGSHCKVKAHGFSRILKNYPYGTFLAPSGYPCWAISATVSIR